MADDLKHETEPRGFGQHTRGLAGEYAHEQGWGIDEEQRTKLPEGPQDTDGGADYDYGARDFGDEPVSHKRILAEAGGAEEETKPEFLDDASAITPSQQAPTETVLEKESAKHHGDPLDDAD